MLAKRKIWLERATNWGIAVAVPLVAIGGFRLLTHARDGAEPLPGQAAPAAATGRVLAPPIDATLPPVVTLQPAAADPRCAAAPDAAAPRDRVPPPPTAAASGCARRASDGR